MLWCLISFGMGAHGEFGDLRGGSLEWVAVAVINVSVGT